MPDPIAWRDVRDPSPRGIAAVMAAHIAGGHVHAGDRLPTVRDVAAELGVSPATVSSAWQALRRAGLVESRGRAGSFVRSRPRTWLSPRVQGLVGQLDELPLDLSRGTPDPALLPPLGGAVGALAGSASTGIYQEDPVLPALRGVLEENWPVPPEALTVVNGAQDAVGLTLEQLVRFGDKVAIESPGFPPFLDMLDLLGAEPVPLVLDAHGVTPGSLAAAVERRVSVVVLQPRSQNPTGVSMTEQRAEELAHVVAKADRPIAVIEDDHSWLISTTPDASLAPWLPDQVVHVRGFSKSHGPDLRIAALGGPGAIVDKVVARRMLGPAWTSRMVQTILLGLLTGDEGIEAVEHAQRAYAARQRALNQALAREGIAMAVPDGINLWLPVADGSAALLELAARGIRAAAGEPFVAPGHAAGPALGPHLRVTSGLVPVENASAVAEALAAASRAR